MNDFRAAKAKLEVDGIVEQEVRGLPALERLPAFGGLLGDLRSMTDRLIDILDRRLD